MVQVRRVASSGLHTEWGRYLLGKVPRGAHGAQEPSHRRLALPCVAGWAALSKLCESGLGLGHPVGRLGGAPRQPPPVRPPGAGALRHGTPATVGRVSRGSAGCPPAGDRGRVCGDVYVTETAPAAGLGDSRPDQVDGDRQRTTQDQTPRATAAPGATPTYPCPSPHVETTG